MRLLKIISMCFLFLTLFTAYECDEDDDTCQDCIDAQVHYCQALLNNGCSATATSTASGRVKDLCPNGSAKVAAIRSQCQLGDNTGCGGFSCE